MAVHTPPRIQPVGRIARRDAAAPLRDGDELFRLALEFEADWMSGPAILRFPEVLRSSAGYHLIDHHRTEIFPLFQLQQLPEFKFLPGGGIVYTCSDGRNLEWTPKAEPAGDDILLSVLLRNVGISTLHEIEFNCCLSLENVPDLPGPGEMASLYAHVDGLLRPLSQCRPSADEKGRDPWLLMATAPALPGWNLGTDSPTWWLLEEVADAGLMAARSLSTGRYLGYAWGTCPPHMMSNGGYPCLHAGPGIIRSLEPGAEVLLEGKIYLAARSLEELAVMYRGDRSRWEADAGMQSACTLRWA